MTLRYGWVLNLDAELELLRPTYTPAAKLLAQLQRNEQRSHALLGPHDVRLQPGSRDVPADLGRAWCPTARAVATIRSAGLEPEPHPTMALLRLVNHRRFAHELGGGLPQQRYVQSRPELESLLHGGYPWLLKRPLSFAGRGQLRLYTTASERDWSWIDASLRVDGLILEPLVRPTVEFSLHGFIWRGGHFELGRPCVQAVSERGVFQGVRLAVTGDLEHGEEHSLFNEAERVARALVGAGYFGPFGIDAYRYDRDGRTALCALSEINARYTMSFAAGFPRPTWELSP